MSNLFKVDYTDPTFGLEPTLPLFIVTYTDMLPPSACDILRRQDHTKDIIVFINRIPVIRYFTILDINFTRIFY
jgi:hypothetical protein